MVSVNKGGWDKSQGFEKDYEFHLAWLEACTGWDYFVNWLKVNEGIRKVEIDLNLLNYLVGKEDIEQEAIKLLREHPKIMQTLPTG